MGAGSPVPGVPAGWDLDRAVARIYRIMVALALFGAAGGLFLRGWRWSVGFLVGSAASYVNFRWLKRIVDAVGGSASGGGRLRNAVLIGLRFFLLWGGAYVIVKYSTLALAGALMGLFVPAAAAILEIIYELAYARSS